MAENPSNIVPDQIILLEGGSKLVPAASSSDSGKVLSVLNSDGDIGWAEGQGGGGTVDQTYDATSTNAQSGTAVAEAVGTPVTLVEGEGIDITESEGSLTIAASADQVYSASSTNAQSGVAVAGAIARVIPTVTSTDDGKVLKAAYSGGAGSYSWQAENPIFVVNDQGVTPDSYGNITFTPSGLGLYTVTLGLIGAQTSTGSSINKVTITQEIDNPYIMEFALGSIPCSCPGALISFTVQMQHRTAPVYIRFYSGTTRITTDLGTNLRMTVIKH